MTKFICFMLVLVAIAFLAPQSTYAQTCSGSVSQTWTVQTCAWNTTELRFSCAASQQSATFGCSWSNIGGSTQCLHEGKPNWTCIVSADGQTCNAGQDPTYPSSSGCNVSYPAPPTPPPPSTPDCNSGISCANFCQPLTANSCSTDNGASSGCEYTTLSSGGSCNPVPAPDQPCTIYNCDPGYSCVNQVCKSNSLNPPSTCTPNCSNASNVCSGTSFGNGCGGSCLGTKNCSAPPPPPPAGCNCNRNYYACQTNLGSIAGCSSACQGVYGTQCSSGQYCSSNHTCVSNTGGGGGSCLGQSCTQDYPGGCCAQAANCCGGPSCGSARWTCQPETGGGSQCSPYCPDPNSVSCGQRAGDGCGGSCSSTGTYCSSGICLNGACTPPPNPPTQVCHPTSGDQDDVCHGQRVVTQGLPVDLSVQNTGPTQAQEPFYTRFNLYSPATSTITTNWVISSNYNQIKSYDITQDRGLPTLQNGTTYYWNAQSYSPATSQISSTTGWWNFLYKPACAKIQTTGGGNVQAQTGINTPCNE